MPMSDFHSTEKIERFQNVDKSGLTIGSQDLSGFVAGIDIVHVFLSRTNRCNQVIVDLLLSEEIVEEQF